MDTPFIQGQRSTTNIFNFRRLKWGPPRPRTAVAEARFWRVLNAVDTVVVVLTVTFVVGVIGLVTLTVLI
jgi:hypothetical protein